MLADMHTLLYWLEIVFLLIGILVACQVFTNAIENLGEALNLNHEFTGSILAAVGTALPETILPLVAIFMSTSSAGS
jgi:cation:H+ antiporter